MTRRHRSGRWVRTTLRLLFEIHGHWCGRCGLAIDPALSGLHPRGGTIGHRVPLSAGGTDYIENLRPEHRACNVSAGDGTRTPRDPMPRATTAEPW